MLDRFQGVGLCSVGFLSVHISLSSDVEEFILHICLLNSISDPYFPFPISCVLVWEKKLKEADTGFVHGSTSMLLSQEGQQ